MTKTAGVSTIRNPLHKSNGRLRPSSTYGGRNNPRQNRTRSRDWSQKRERFSVPHASKDPKILQEMNLENEDIFESIKNPPEVGAVRIFQQPELLDTIIGPTQAVTTQGIATIHLPSGPLSMDGAQWHLLKHTLTNNGSNPIGSSLQTELTRQLILDKD